MPRVMHNAGSQRGARTKLTDKHEGDEIDEDQEIEWPLPGSAVAFGRTVERAREALANDSFHGIHALRAHQENTSERASRDRRPHNVHCRARARRVVSSRAIGLPGPGSRRACAPSARVVTRASRRPCPIQRS